MTEDPNMDNGFSSRDTYIRFNNSTSGNIYFVLKVTNSFTYVFFLDKKKKCIIVTEESLLRISGITLLGSEVPLRHSLLGE